MIGEMIDDPALALISLTTAILAVLAVLAALGLIGPGTQRRRSMIEGRLTGHHQSPKPTMRQKNNAGRRQ